MRVRALFFAWVAGRRSLRFVGPEKGLQEGRQRLKHRGGEMARDLNLEKISRERTHLGKFRMHLAVQNDAKNSLTAV
jgi:hypothetical protein